MRISDWSAYVCSSDLFRSQRCDLACGGAVGGQFARELTGRHAVGEDNALMDFRFQRWQRLFGKRTARLAADDGGADAPIDDEGGGEPWPEHLRLADQRHHLGTRPQVVGTRLYR